jgi:hypothetical protein
MANRRGRTRERFMRFHFIARMVAACAMLAAVSPGARAGDAPVQVLQVDMAARIDRVAKFPSRFAVDVPFNASPATDGAWTTTGATSTWHHTLQIPGAVSMSFHATPVRLPPTAVLKVTVGGVDYVYRAKDVSATELWSRVGRGDTMAFELTVATTDRATTRLEITSLQAGYRSFDSPQRNHPHFKALSATGQAAAAIESCTENWSCHTSSVNTGPGQATVALIIGNVGQCTGVLLNDVPGDGTPYVLTARHCENGDPDGGTPGAAGSLTVYWNAITPCSQALGSIYSPGIPAQFGADTVVEQQDTWLVRLKTPPIVDDAYYAGWDATGAAFVGGFTAHHGLGGARQFTGWFGQANFQTVPGSALGVGFNSTLWGTVNAVGSVSPGASGSGIFDATGRLVGTLSRASLQGSDDDSPGVCPAPSPPVPSPQSSTAVSTALSGVFASTADPKSTTGSVTIQSVLDPDHTGRMVMDGQTSPPFLFFSAGFGADPQTSFSRSLSWNTKNVTSCTASGGVAGDGWAGAKPLAGSAGVTSFDEGDVEYVLTCSDGTRSVTKRLTLHWVFSMPSVDLHFLGSEPFGTPFEMSWTSTVRPCVPSGGHPGDGWSGTFATETRTMVTETEPGQVTYTLTCGSGARTATSQISVQIRPPSATLGTEANAPLRIGEIAHLGTTTSGRPCVATGGAVGDGWAGTTIPSEASTAFTVTENAPGTYTYTVACGSGAFVATAQTTIMFTADAPSVSLTATPNPALAAPISFSGGGEQVVLSWVANVHPCTISIISPLPATFPGPITDSPQGSALASSFLLGDITYKISCGSGANSAQATTVVTYTGTPGVVASSPLNVIAGSQFTVGALKNNLLPCTATGGTAGDGWAGPMTFTTALLPQTNVSVVENTAGTYTYTVTCGSGAQQITTQTTTTVLATAPFVTITASKQQAILGEDVTITWNSNTSPCTSVGGTATDGWGGPIPSSGSRTLTEHDARIYFYRVVCGLGGTLIGDSEVQVTFIVTAPPQLQANATSVVVGDAVTLTWSSSDGSTCNAAGGTAGDGWSGAKAASGSQQVRESGPRTYTYFLTCGAAPMVTLNVTFTTPPPLPQPVLPPSVTLNASSTTVTAGDSFNLTYTPANADACTAAGGSVADGWQTNGLTLSGASQSVRETTAGTYTYSITCTRTGFPAATSSVTVTVNPQVVVPGTPPGGGGSSGGGGGGGGGFGGLEVGYLAALVFLRRRWSVTARKVPTTTRPPW